MASTILILGSGLDPGWWTRVKASLASSCRCHKREVARAVVSVGRHRPVGISSRRKRPIAVVAVLSRNDSARPSHHVGSGDGRLVVVAVVPVLSYGAVEIGHADQVVGRVVAVGFLARHPGRRSVRGDLLGHASAAMTLDTYADLFDDDLDMVASALDRARTASNIAEILPPANLSSP